MLLVPADPADDERVGFEAVGSFSASTGPPLIVLDRAAHRARHFGIGDRLMGVFGGHRPVHERTRRIAVPQGRFVDLSILQDHCVGPSTSPGDRAFAWTASALTAPGGSNPPNSNRSSSSQRLIG